jgi:DNA-binding response OmpR family regulator
MKKILVVDDDRDILEIVSYILTSRGFNVSTHTTGLNVPEAVMQFSPDVILLDINLPGKLGTEVCKELKKIHSIPVILFSAHAKEGKVIAECNADGFIAKPFDMEALVKRIKAHLN